MGIGIRPEDNLILWQEEERKKREKDLFKLPTLPQQTEDELFRLPELPKPSFSDTFAAGLKPWGNFLSGLRDAFVAFSPVIPGSEQFMDPAQLQRVQNIRNSFSSSTLPASLVGVGKRGAEFFAKDIPRFFAGAMLAEAKDWGITTELGEEYYKKRQELVEQSTQFVSQGIANPGGTLGGITASIATLPVSILETPLSFFTGTDIFDDELTPLSAEERTQKAMDVAAFIISTGVGSKVRKAYGTIGTVEATGMKPLELFNALGQQTDNTLLQAVDETLLSSGQLMKHRAVRGLLEGSISGAAYGVVSGMGTDEIWEKVVENAILFAPIGLAFEFAHATGALQKQAHASKIASFYNALYQYRADVDQSISAMIKNRNLLTENPDLLFDERNRWVKNYSEVLLDRTTKPFITVYHGTQHMYDTPVIRPNTGVGDSWQGVGSYNAEVRAVGERYAESAQSRLGYDVYNAVDKIQKSPEYLAIVDDLSKKYTTIKPDQIRTVITNLLFGNGLDTVSNIDVKSQHPFRVPVTAIVDASDIHRVMDNAVIPIDIRASLYADLAPVFKLFPDQPQSQLQKRRLYVEENEILWQELPFAQQHPDVQNAIYKVMESFSFTKADVDNLIAEAPDIDIWRLLFMNDELAKIAAPGSHTSPSAVFSYMWQKKVNLSEADRLKIDQQISDEFSKNGVKAYKYLDARSRERRHEDFELTNTDPTASKYASPHSVDSTYNYVVTDPSRIFVESSNGVLVNSLTMDDVVFKDFVSLLDTMEFGKAFDHTYGKILRTGEKTVNGVTTDSRHFADIVKANVADRILEEMKVFPWREKLDKHIVDMLFAKEEPGKVKDLTPQAWNAIYGGKHAMEATVNNKGLIELRMQDSKKTVAVFSTMDEAVAFANSLNDPVGGIALDNDIFPNTRLVIPSTVNPLNPAFGGPNASSATSWAPTKMQYWKTKFAMMAPKNFGYLPRSTMWNAIETVTNGNVKMTRYFDRLRAARLKEEAASKTDLDVVTKLFQRAEELKLTEADRVRLGAYMNAYTPTELMVNMSADVIETAKQLHQLTKGNLAAHRLGATVLQSYGPEVLAEYAKGMKWTDSDMQAINLINTISQNNLALDQISRLVQAWGDDINDVTKHSKGKAEFNFSPEMAKLAEDLHATYKQLKTTYGDTGEYDYFTLLADASLYQDKTLRQFASSLRDLKDQSPGNMILNDILRSGEASEFSPDPIFGLQRYVRGYYASQRFRPELNKVMQELQRDIAQFQKLSGDEQAGLLITIQREMDDFVSSLRGWRTSEDLMAHQSENAIRVTFNQVVTDRSKVDAYIRMIQSAMSLGLMGFRPKYGLMDQWSSTMSYGMFFGFSEAIEAATLGWKLWKEGSELVERGDVFGIDLNKIRAFGGFETKSQVFKKEVGVAFDKLTEAGFKYTGQKAVWEANAMGVYEVARRKLIDNHKLYEAGILSDKEFFKAIGLSNYDAGLQTYVKDLIENKNPTLASEVLGRATIDLTMPVFGYGSQGRGWTTRWGRIFGQLGSYSSFATGMLMRATMNGSGKDVIMRMARLSAIYAAMGIASHETGMDLSQWYLHKAVFPTYADAPLIRMGINARTMAFGSSSYAQEQAQYELGKDLFTPIPGSRLVMDLFAGAEAARKGRPPLQVAGRYLGIPVFKSPNPTWDDVFNSMTYPWE